MVNAATDIRPHAPLKVSAPTINVNFFMRQAGVASANDARSRIARSDTLDSVNLGYRARIRMKLANIDIWLRKATTIHPPNLRKPKMYAYIVQCENFNIH